ncbi:putative membrane protein YdbT with pleckstrin-like domain [Actinoalloteichus hoggarensis]|uniref:Bacterial membrane flanked domain protein n=1 Tax=Actinoalloteichus hoggarensis TaxID=1470176 RepID=A0A221VYJ6_9PSEU|nr:PH domain-containing protein [Actinoalloteichus hoggarensis]ASO18564.1 Bacterial membrane flanked domain protein [Actinoalloteichus hoggarensis]MBB5921932.1 putative membrane protein YdbT with pleckstrin-like domain [Actinoalloteichus hoggarensis]
MLAPRDPDEYLLESERRVIRVRRHWASMLWDIFEATALLVGLMLISSLMPPGSALIQNILWYAGLLVVLRFSYYVIEWWVERIVVTDKRFMLTTGVFETNVAMMPVTKVTDLTFRRTLMGRFFGYGTLVIESAGQIQALNKVEYCPNPEEINDAISELVFGDKKAQAERFSMMKARRAALGRRRVGARR